VLLPNPLPRSGDRLLPARSGTFSLVVFGVTGDCPQNCSGRVRLATAVVAALRPCWAFARRDRGGRRLRFAGQEAGQQYARPDLERGGLGTAVGDIMFCAPVRVRRREAFDTLARLSMTLCLPTGSRQRGGSTCPSPADACSDVLQQMERTNCRQRLTPSCRPVSVAKRSATTPSRAPWPCTSSSTTMFTTARTCFASTTTWAKETVQTDGAAPSANQLLVVSSRLETRSRRLRCRSHCRGRRQAAVARVDYDATGAVP